MIALDWKRFEPSFVSSLIVDFFLDGPPCNEQKSHIRSRWLTGISQSRLGMTRLTLAPLTRFAFGLSLPDSLSLMRLRFPVPPEGALFFLCFFSLRQRILLKPQEKSGKRGSSDLPFTRRIRRDTARTYVLTVKDQESKPISWTRTKTAPEDVSSLSYSWSSHERERQNTLRVVFSNAAF